MANVGSEDLGLKLKVSILTNDDDYTITFIHIALFPHGADEPGAPSNEIQDNNPTPLQSVRSELQSVHTEHQNELAARDYSRVQELEQLRVHYEGLLTDAGERHCYVQCGPYEMYYVSECIKPFSPLPPGGQPALLNTTVREAELHSDTVTELHANTELDAVRELQGNVKQLQEKLSEANSQRKRQQAYLAQVTVQQICPEKDPDYFSMPKNMLVNENSLANWSANWSIV